MSESRASGTNREALDRLIPLVYHELHRIAESHLHRDPQNHTLQPTALIHEAYLRLVERGFVGFKSRPHFFGAVARVMRHVLVNHARTQQAVSAGAPPDSPPEPNRTVAALDDALRALAVVDESKARLVELRFFGGMTTEEIAQHSGLPVHAVRRKLRAAQAWLRREMESGRDFLP